MDINVYASWRIEEEIIVKNVIYRKIVNTAWSEESSVV